MNDIHSTALVSKKAKLGDNVKVDAYAVIKDNVEIGDDCYIGPYAVIYDGARLEKNVQIFQSASVANLPQDLKFENGETYFYIGENTVIREFVTLHRGTFETGYSKVGKNCLLMNYVHVAHDCTVGDNCVIANGVQLAGHVHIGHWVTVGGMSPIHQFVKVGNYSMIGGGYRINADVPPYILAANEPLKYSGVNVIGLRRRGFSNDDIRKIKNVYHILFLSGLNLSKAKEKLVEELPEDKYAVEILRFINSSDRGLIKR